MKKASKDGKRGRADHCGCTVDIRIKSKGDVNVYACSGPAGHDDDGGDQPEPCCPPASCDPIAPGQCLPVTLGAKPKQAARQKLDTILASSKVPSVLAAGFFRHARRYLAGEGPANALETQAFALFDGMSDDLKGLLRCASASVASMSAADRDRVLDPGILGGSGPLDAVTLATAFGRELASRARDALFGDPDAQERPGLNRFYDVPLGEENFDVQLRICSVNDLRTGTFAPPLGLGDYLPAELQQSCTPIVVNGQTELSCQTQNGNCPGRSLGDGSCLRVPDVEAGASVVLKGVNFISVDAKVRIEARAPLSLVREVDAFVFGDLDTPLTEVVNGEVATIRDCRVHDQITFKVPDDLPSGVYGITIVMPNVSGFPNLGDPLTSNQEFIAVVPPAGALFTIASEELVAREETSPAFLGSDEVRVRVRAYPLTLSDTGLALGDEQAFDSPEFEMDSGDRRDMAAVLFANAGPIDGVAMTIMGFEIDSETAYREQINDFSAAFWHYLKIAATAVFAAGAAGALALGLKDLLLLALAHPILLAIAAALTLGVVIFLAGWAPADPLIVDAIGFTRLDLAALTNANLPLPAASTAITTKDISVNISPLEKLPNQYRERREYVGPDSRYEIVLRYNRVG